MLTSHQKDQFNNDGYLLVPQVLDEKEVATLRTALVTHLESLFGTDRSEPRFVTDVFSRFPDIRWLLFHDRVLSVLRSLLGDDFAVLRETSVHLNNYSSGWHRDTESQEQAGQAFHWDDDYLMVEAAFYLQENDDEFGGGLDVYPGSHKAPDPPETVKNKALRRLRAKTGMKLGADDFVRVPSKPGDLVIFDFRTRHRSTPSKHVPPPVDRQKIALFMACSRNNSHVGAYHAYLETRSQGYEYLKNFAYPPEMLEQASRVRLHLP